MGIYIWMGSWAIYMGPDGPESWHIEMVYIFGQADKWYISISMGPPPSTNEWCIFTDGPMGHIYGSRWAHVMAHRDGIYFGMG